MSKRSNSTLGLPADPEPSPYCRNPDAFSDLRTRREAFDLFAAAVMRTVVNAGGWSPQ